ncbi:AmmeMemoRadiSam system radical SAM enzyme [bacterium]|nr:AmmeMemoRadiSam system radical SAM enzyme [bacterium]MCB2202225.1 AmmeMemoRadiSam system radical SAM enzyme [bacterium]
MIHAAAHWQTTDSGLVQCNLCPANCTLKEGQHGICRSRYSHHGHLVTDNYGELVTVAVDPIEKKPLYHFYPGSMILSTGANCCNLGCRHCQNWSISQVTTRTTYCPPEQLAHLAEEHDSIGVAFTYTEPMVWFEYICDTAPLLRAQNKKVVLVSNGYINPEPLAELLPFIDAANIDLKGMRPRFYARICKGRLDPVLDTIRAMAGAGIHLEITNLVIPGYNDSDEDLQLLIDFVASVDTRIPLHFSAYHPDYKLQAPPTPHETLQRAFDMARKSLAYPFVGNAYIRGTSDTHCPSCGTILIERSGFGCRIGGLEAGKCTLCGAETRIRHQAK